jgi:transcriptional antiterminator RfaH
MTSSSFDPAFSHVYPDAALRRAYDRDPEGRWYVLRTKPRQETRAQENLKAWGLQTLLPLWPEPRVKHRRDRDHSMAQVVFPSYIFCRFHDDMFAKVKFTYGVAHIVSFGGVPAVVDQAIIDELAARAHGATGEPSPIPRESLTPGDKVMIESGPFKNLMGVFDQDLPGGERVRILLGAVKLGCAREDVRKIDNLTTETRRKT